MNIRPAENKDFEDLQRLYQQVFAYELEQQDIPGWNADFPFEKKGIEYFNKAIENKDGYAGFVYEEDNKNIAYVILRRIPDEELRLRKGVQLAELHTICVDHGHRGKGIGQKLITFAKQWAIDNGASHLKLVVMAKNKQARDVYKKAGFEEFDVTYEMPLPS